MPAKSDKAVHDTLARRRLLAGRTDAFRVSHYELHPEITLDCYAGHLLATVYPKTEKNPEGAARYWCEQAAQGLKAVLGIEVSSAVWKLRPDNLSHLPPDEADKASGARTLFGEPPADRFQIHENGVPLLVSMHAGFSTGLFLDMRDGRKVLGALVRRRAESGKAPKVLNLFSYTGAFSSVAAAAGAESVTEVDTGGRWLDWSKDNAALSGAQDLLIQKQRDAIDYLEYAARRNELFDVIVADPPSYSTNKSDRFTVRDGYLKMVPLFQKVLAKDGQLIAASNHGGWTWAAFRQALTSFRLVERIPAPEDFPGADYLKVGLFEKMR